MNTQTRRLNTRSSLSTLTMSTIYLPFYDSLCLRLDDEVVLSGVTYTWGPCSGIRSFMSQDNLYGQGREQVDGIWVVKHAGKVVTNAKGGQSPHNYSCATDWCLWTEDGEPHWPAKSDPIWQTYIDAVMAAGLRPGAEFGDVDHNELKITVPWSSIGIVFFDRGPEAAKSAIQTALSPPKEATT